MNFSLLLVVLCAAVASVAAFAPSAFAGSALVSV
jgi:hypothetical protein